MKKILLFFFLFSVLLFSCCEEVDRTVLPPETQTGKGMLGFKANGDICVWTQRYYFPQIPVNSAYFIYRDKGRDTLRIIARGEMNLSSEEFSLSVYVNRPEPNKALSIAGASLRGRESEGGYFDYRSEENSGAIFFTSFDLEKGIASGRFSVDLYNKNRKIQKISITEGRFDLPIID